MTRTVIPVETADEAALLRQNAKKALENGEDILLRYSERVNGKMQMTFDYGDYLSEDEVMTLLKGKGDE